MSNIKFTEETIEHFLKNLKCIPNHEETTVSDALKLTFPDCQISNDPNDKLLNEAFEHAINYAKKNIDVHEATVATDDPRKFVSVNVANFAHGFNSYLVTDDKTKKHIPGYDDIYFSTKGVVARDLGIGGMRMYFSDRLALGMIYLHYQVYYFPCFIYMIIIIKTICYIFNFNVNFQTLKIEIIIIYHQ
jgi:hypothetical protein